MLLAGPTRFALHEPTGAASTGLGKELAGTAGEELWLAELPVWEPAAAAVVACAGCGLPLGGALSAQAALALELARPAEPE